jgi:hypothetical protein
VVFDPDAGDPGAPGYAVPLQVFRRSARGQFLRVYRGRGPAESTVLGRWLVITEDGKRLRLARNAEGTDLVATKDERVQAGEERARRAEGRLAEALAELERLKGTPR